MSVPQCYRKPVKMMKVALSVLLFLVAMSSAFGKYVPKTGNRIPQTLSRGLYALFTPQRLLDWDISIVS